ncbi:hypothetical protein BXZ70DRAFT_1006940 [Cristinia sonorae]|uniref:BHLH domain-containing protein n=1 Tax=Cristinia sonorae TaxID=1940300 RepID=A0A8K0URA7_9AGAR|nr:hypothetical protein BXZ70DRAFT_1006940 [Cristinia sonorae]
MAAVVPPKDSAEYARSCNPPRRAKRARRDDEASPPAPSGSVPAAPYQPPPRVPQAHILPKDNARHKPQDNESSDEGEDDYDPSASAPVPKRRGRKPGPMSRSARESQRKLNHSRIEKARRTKINETLATLSELVNDAEKEKLARGISAAETVSSEGAKEKGKSEKEFKLDVLVKAVSYVQELIARVKALEAQQCTHCTTTTAVASATIPPPGKRKRSVADDEDADAAMAGDGDDLYIGDDEQGGEEPDEEDDDSRHHPPSSRYSSVHPSPRLPPIASWLPHPYVDPSCIAAMSDSNAPNAPNTSQPSHLPSPPMSGTFRTSQTYSLHALPSLTLPGPARPLPPTAHTHVRTSPEAAQQATISITRRMSQPQIPTSRRVSASPSVSPTWTPEDETAASMLLQMSSSPRSASSTSSSHGISSLKLPQPAPEAPRPQDHQRPVAFSSLQMQVQTPSSMLGM